MNFYAGQKCDSCCVITSLQMGPSPGQQHYGGPPHGGPPHGGPPQYLPGMAPSARHPGAMGMGMGPGSKGGMAAGPMPSMSMYRRHTPYPHPHSHQMMHKRQMSFPPNGTQIDVSGDVTSGQVFISSGFF